jgi:hypothetical protein
MAGEAMARAANLVDVASPGEIMVAENSHERRAQSNSMRSPRQQGASAGGYRMTADSDALSPFDLMDNPGSPRQLHKKSVTSHPPVSTPGGSSQRKLSITQRPSVTFSMVPPSPLRKGTANSNNFGSSFFSTSSFESGTKRGTLLSERTDAHTFRAQSDLREVRGNTAFSQAHDEEQVISILTADNPCALVEPVAEDPILRAGLPRSCNVYIPAALRAKGAMEDVVPEMKAGVSVVFVELEVRLIFGVCVSFYFRDIILEEMEHVIKHVG